MDENANLIVYITGDSVRSRTNITNILGDNIITKYCKYSFQELKDVMNQIATFAENNINSPIVDNLSVVSLMDRENNIVVKLLDCSDQKISEFKDQVIDSEFIVFEETASKVSPFSTFSPGDKLDSSARGGSFGYRVTRYGQTGYISSAHGVDLYTVIVADGYQVGYCSMRQYSGSVDASFSEDLYVLDYSPTIAGTSTRLDGSVQDPYSGMNIYKSGTASQVTSGWVISTSTTAVSGSGNDKILLRDVVSTTCHCVPGDSGGPVYTNSFGGNASITGIVHGGEGNIYYYIKASNINNAFGCSPY